MADGDHIPHDPPLMSKKITIHVVGGAKPPDVASQQNAPRQFGSRATRSPLTG